jgi:hypothetical protein
MRYVFFTFRPHPQDLTKFDDYLLFFINFCKEHESYAYTVEKEDTPARHVHALLGDPSYKDMTKFRQKYNGKKRGLKQYEKMILAGKQTNIHGWDTRLIPDDHSELMKTLGYINKETSIRSDTNFNDNQITEAIKAYHAHARLDAIKPETQIDDWTIINSKNVMSHLQIFMKKYKDKYDLHDYLSPLMLRALSKEHYSLTNISAKSLQVARRQLNIAYYDTIEHFQKVDEDYYIEQDGPQQIEPHGQIEFIQQNNMDHLNQILAEETYTTSSGETKQTHSLKYQ